MAATAISLASSILASAITKATTAAAEEISQLLGVQKEIWFMKDELKTIQAFLVTAEAMKKKNPLLKVWAEQVRSLSYDIEDCLDEFMVHMRSQSLSHQLRKLKDRHRIAIKIRNLKSRVEEVSSRNTRYNLIEAEDTNIDEAHSSSMEDVRNNSVSNIDETQLVGFDTPKRVLLEMINSQDNNVGQPRVICVVGMGGLGKTTLVRKVYDSKEGILKKFSCFAWITVSQSFSKIEMLKDMILKLIGPDSLKRRLEELEGKVMQVQDLANYLREELKEKRYFVVLDDMWDIGDWNWIRNISLPDSNNRASQIIVTTRNANLAMMCTTNSLIYHLEPLKEEHAIRLLLMKIGKKREDMENDEKLKDFVKRLVKKCGYLPLAMVLIGALFGTKHESEWDRLYTQLPSELENNLSLEAIKSMVILSYSHLPSHLKPCFLYLSIFPEDFEIKRNSLVNRWIAEGFVRGRVGMTLEDVGENYFNELINRNMMQPSKVNFEGIVKRCRVHDIMRDIIVSLSRDEDFVYTCGDNIPGLVEDSYCPHVAYHFSKQCSTIAMDWDRVRSLTIFGEERPIEHSPSLCASELRMMRILDLENAGFRVTQIDMSNIGLLRHLKYVKIRYSDSYALPSSMEKLQGLQELDIRFSYIGTLPSGICKLQSLRILCCHTTWIYNYKPLEWLKNSFMAYSSFWSEKPSGLKVPRGIGNLKELQILGVVDIGRTSSKAIGELGEIIKLRKLKISTLGATEKKCITICKAIQKLSSLTSLQISDWGGTIEWLDSVFSPPPVLRKLTLLGGRIGYKVEWFRNLTNLVKLHLMQTELDQEGKIAMEILGALPNLMLLVLGAGSYAGKELVFGQGAFLNLRKLIIWDQDQLREIRFEQDTSPKMESIESSRFCRLELGIIGIKYLPNLKEISLSSKVKAARLSMLQDELNAHPNQPVLRGLSEDPAQCSDESLADQDDGYGL